MKMSAYFYSFDHTGVEEIDRILSAVACAGKAFHGTEHWLDDCETPEGHWLDDCETPEGHSGKYPVAWVSNSAISASLEIRKLRSTVVDLWKMLGSPQFINVEHKNILDRALKQKENDD